MVKTGVKEMCAGPSTYRAEEVDQVVDSILSGIFFRAESVKESKLLTAVFRFYELRFSN